MTFGAASNHSLLEVPLFANLNPAAIERLNQTSWARQYPRGQVLTSEGDPGESLLVLEEGEIKISRFTLSGQEVVLRVAEAPYPFGELALIDGAPRSATVTALTDVSVRMVPRTTFLELLNAEPDAMMEVLKSMTAMIRMTNDRLSDFLFLDVPGRVAKWLLVRGTERGERRDGNLYVPFGLSQSELATVLSTTRVSINKALKTFEGQDLIVLHGDEIELKNLDGLIQYTF